MILPLNAHTRTRIHTLYLSLSYVHSFGRFFFFLFRFVEWRQYSYNPETGELGNRTQNINIYIAYNKQDIELRTHSPQLIYWNTRGNFKLLYVTFYTSFMQTILNHVKNSPMCVLHQHMRFNNILDLISERIFSYAAAKMSTNEK